VRSQKKHRSGIGAEGQGAEEHHHRAGRCTGASESLDASPDERAREGQEHETIHECNERLGPQQPEGVMRRGGSQCQASADPGEYEAAHIGEVVEGVCEERQASRVEADTRLRNGDDEIEDNRGAKR
jgi:hypothetical protein